MTSISGSVDDGSGSLVGNGVGTAQWIILPTRNAAPINATYYDFAGTLSYTLNGVQLVSKLYPGKKRDIFF